MLLRKSIPKLVVLIVIIMVYSPCDSYVYADTCGSEGSGLRIRINGTDESWLFVWHANEIEKQKIAYSSLDLGQRSNVHKPSGDEGSAGLPQGLFGLDMRLDAPFAVSQSRQTLIACIHPNAIALIPSDKFAIIDLRSKEVLQVIKTEYYVWSLAWSPRNEYFAVLLQEDVTSQKWRGPRDWFSKLVGHPISYNTLYVAIYNSDGKFICKKPLIEKLVKGRGYVEWLEKNY
jgi:hypothetical protein